jgi:hypothetical protein
LLIASVIEGAALVGWRLTQAPKSQSFEFLLASPLWQTEVFLGEAAAGVGQLCLVTLSGLPVLLLLWEAGRLGCLDIVVLIVVQCLWGTLTGLGLVAWAYESAVSRRRIGHAMIVALLIYLGVGLFAGEHLRQWIAVLPDGAAWAVLTAFEASHRYSPFAVLAFWLEQPTAVALDRVVGLQCAALAGSVLLAGRASSRVKAHFEELHFETATGSAERRSQAIGNHPLSWWAKRRVTRYSGRINLWLAAGFCSAYAAYTVFEGAWPPWLGRAVFRVFDQAGGLPALASAMVILAAVPAAFQYGLWDQSTLDRRRRLELLLLTRLRASDYWRAAAAAAWRRGRGYFAVAGVLWLAATLSGELDTAGLLSAMGTGLAVWGLYFAAGFLGFCRGTRANALGMVLSLGLPAAAYSVHRAGWPVLAALTPPGCVYAVSLDPRSLAWRAGALVAAMLGLLLAWCGLAHCDGELRRWYERCDGHRQAE